MNAVEVQALRKHFNKRLVLDDVSMVVHQGDIIGEPIRTTVSLQRSSKDLAKKAEAFTGGEDRLVLYSGYPSSLPFYLRIRRPIAVVWSGKQRAVLGSEYVASRRPDPAPGYGKVLYTREEFADLWRSSKHRLVAFVDRGGLEEFVLLQKIPPRKLAELGGTILIENRRAD